MGIDPNSLPDALKNKIADPEEKKRVGPTWAEKVAKKDDQTENELRDQVISFCTRHDLIPISPDPTRKSTIKKGAPDLTICGSADRFLFMELKVGTNQLSEDQKKFRDLTAKIGCSYLVIRDYGTAVTAITIHFGLKFTSPEQ